MGMDLLAPWEQIEYFEAPVTVTVTGVQPFQAVTQLVPYDQMRVYLCLCLPNNANNALVGVDPAINLNSQGRILTANYPAWEIFQSTHGPLVNQAWFAFIANTVSVVAISIRMKRWPRGRDKSLEDLLQKSVLSRANGGRSATNCRKRQA